MTTIRPHCLGIVTLLLIAQFRKALIREVFFNNVYFMFTGTVTGTELGTDAFSTVGLVQDINYRAVVSNLSPVYFLLEAPFSF